jgi:hypothetical protein
MNSVINPGSAAIVAPTIPATTESVQTNAATIPPLPDPTQHEDYTVCERLAYRYMESVKSQLRYVEHVGVKNVHTNVFSVGKMTNGAPIHSFVHVEFPDPGSAYGFRQLPSGSAVRNKDMLGENTRYFVFEVPDAMRSAAAVEYYSPERFEQRIQRLKVLSNCVHYNSNAFTQFGLVDNGTIILELTRTTAGAQWRPARRWGIREVEFDPMTPEMIERSMRLNT